MLRQYEKVKVLSCSVSPDRVGTFGYVLGFSEDDEGTLHGYFVMFPDWGRGLTLSKDCLQGTGEIAKRSDFFDEEVSTLRVGVRNGKGFLVRDN